MKAEDVLKRLEKEGFRKKEPSFWKPESEGDHIKGTYLGFEQGDLSKIHSIEVDGEVFHFYGTTVLDKKLSGMEGKEIAIVYMGRKKNDKGIEYHDFVVMEK